MYSILKLSSLLVPLFFWKTYAASRDPLGYALVNGQIYTAGLAIIDSPQPASPEGGDYLQIALDVSGNGHLPVPSATSGQQTTSVAPLPTPTSPSADFLRNITIFLTSYSLQKNFTISNGTRAGWASASNQNDIWDSASTGNATALFSATAAASSSAEALATGTSTIYGCSNADTPWGWRDAGCLPLLAQEPGSTVKHVNWVYPDCFIGNGGGSGNSGSGSGSARGNYNISIHQAFRYNGSDYYTITDIPISISNAVPASVANPHAASTDFPLPSPPASSANGTEVGAIITSGASTIPTSTTVSNLAPRAESEESGNQNQNPSLASTLPHTGNSARPLCAALSNSLVSDDVRRRSVHSPDPWPWNAGGSTANSNSNSGGSTSGSRSGSSALTQRLCGGQSEHSRLWAGGLLVGLAMLPWLVWG